MPANDVKFGISRHTGTLIDSVETDDSVQVKELPGSNGEIARVKPYRKMTEGSVKGHGALAVVPGVGDPGVSGLPNAGVTVITNVKHRREQRGLRRLGIQLQTLPDGGDRELIMQKGDQLCILRAEVKTEADALNLLRLDGAFTALGIPLDDDCPYLETRELVEDRERRLVTWTLKARSICGQHDARKLIGAWHDPVWTTQNAEHPFAYIIRPPISTPSSLLHPKLAHSPSALSRQAR